MKMDRREFTRSAALVAEESGIFSNVRLKFTPRPCKFLAMQKGQPVAVDPHDTENPVPSPEEPSASSKPSKKPMSHA
jgi:hypothetical protein